MCIYFCCYLSGRMALVIDELVSNQASFFNVSPVLTLKHVVQRKTETFMHYISCVNAGMQEMRLHLEQTNSAGVS